MLTHKMCRIIDIMLPMWVNIIVLMELKQNFMAIEWILPELLSVSQMS